MSLKYHSFEEYERQVHLAEKMNLQTGLNIVTCRNCGAVNLIEGDRDTVECYSCGFDSDPRDFPDLLYSYRTADILENCRCGSDLVEIHRNKDVLPNQWQCGCLSCGIKAPFQTSKFKAIDEWNRMQRKMREDTESYPSISEMQEEGLNPASSGDAMLFSLCRKSKPESQSESRDEENKEEEEEEDDTVRNSIVKYYPLTTGMRDCKLLTS